VVLVAAFAFAAPAAGFMGLVDFGAHIDGPGIGYSPTQLVAPFLFGVAVLAFVAVLLLAARWPWARWRAILPGIGLAAAFVAMGAPLALLHASWRRACASGSAAACDAIAQMKRRGDPAPPLTSPTTPMPRATPSP
jgi:hypothetical protein